MEVEKSGWREVLCVPGESIFIIVWAIGLTACFVYSASSAAVRQARRRRGDETGVSADAVIPTDASATAHERGGDCLLPWYLANCIHSTTKIV